MLGNNDGEDQGLHRIIETPWPKILGLEQMVQDMEIKRVNDFENQLRGTVINPGKYQKHVANLQIGRLI